MARPKKDTVTSKFTKKTTQLRSKAPSKTVAQEVKATAPKKDVSSSSFFDKISPSNLSVKNIISYRPSKGAYLLLLAIGLLLLASYKKEWFIAATIGNTPVSNLELQQRLNKQYREQILNQIINEKILLNEASKKGITFSDKEIDAKVAEVEKKVGGSQTLDSLLTSQGQTRDSFRQQLKFQLIIEKLYGNEATISAQEVKDFISQNKNQLQATDSAGQEKEAEDILKQEKLSQTFPQKFQELKQQTPTRIF